MRPGGCEADLLRTLAAMPFLDRQEMVAVSGWSRGAVYEAVERLEGGGFAAWVPHATDLLAPTRRFHLTADGLDRLAGEAGVSPDELVHRYPVSGIWRRILMERLDALAAIYRLTAGIAHAAYPLRFHWYRARPLDAAVDLPDGRTVGIVRRGLTADRTGFSRRMRKLRDGPLPGAVLVLMPDEVGLRHARRMLTGSPVPFFLALEREAVEATPADPVWAPPAVQAAIDLRTAIERAEARGELPREPQLARASAPADLALGGPGWNILDHMLPTYLKPGEKRAADLLSDWPWIVLKDLAALLGVSAQRASELVNPLEGFGLVTRLVAGSGRLALTDRGLTMLAHRDRTSVGIAKKRWSVAPRVREKGFDWRSVSGGRSRQLLRNIEHTAAVHAFVAALARQAVLTGWEVVQLDPPRRASRYFRHGDSRRSIHPDAFGVLRKDGVTWPFFLEWERRAVRPVTMSERLAPYLRYYASHRPIDDHGVRPDVLIVFDNETAAAHFLRVAREEMQARRVTVPLWVSHAAAIHEMGPLGRAWRGPGHRESPRDLPATVNDDRERE